MTPSDLPTYMRDEGSPLRGAKEDVPERSRFTFVFAGDISKFAKNPFKTETPFGIPITAGYGDAFAEVDDLRNQLNAILSPAQRTSSPTPPDSSLVPDEMVSRALQGFDTGVGDPNDYRRRMRAALEAAKSKP